MLHWTQNCPWKIQNRPKMEIVQFLTNFTSATLVFTSICVSILCWYYAYLKYFQNHSLKMCILQAYTLPVTIIFAQRIFKVHRGFSDVPLLLSYMIKLCNKKKLPQSSIFRVIWNTWYTILIEALFKTKQSLLNINQCANSPFWYWDFIFTSCAAASRS